MLWLALGIVVFLTIKSEGTGCVFPFVYKGESFDLCIAKDSWFGYWCSQTSDFDKDQKWSYCTAFGVGAQSQQYKQCVFPFVYQGKSYTSCTSKSSILPKWCSITSNYDLDKQWGYCPDGTDTPTTAGNASGACVFPFTYKGKEYKSCTTVDWVPGRPWCATVSNYDANPKKWAYCQGSGIITTGTQTS